MREIFQQWVGKTNIFQYLGVHYVDLIYFLTGARPMRALATGQPHGSASTEIPGADAIQGLIEWEDQSTRQRFVSTIVTNWIDPNSTSAVSDQKITVVGTRGRYQADQKDRGVQLVTEEHQGVEEVNPYFSQFYRGGDSAPGFHGYGPRCITQFLMDVRDITQGQRQVKDLLATRPSFQQSLVSTAVIEAVNRSLAQDSAWTDVEDTAQCED
jgi:predicted dehydrogenase